MPGETCNLHDWCRVETYTFGVWLMHVGKGIMKNHEIQEANAPKILEWFRDRGGLAIWDSVNLSNPGASWTAPVNDEHGKPKGKPTWEASNEPSRVITDMAEVDVITAQEIKRFHIGVRMGSQGLSLKVTDGGTRRIRAAVAKANLEHGEDKAWYVLDRGTQEAVIMVEAGRVPLAEWAEKKEGP